jgi:dihydroflavonol-4-reductase
LLAQVSGRPAPRVKLPYWPVLAMAYIDEFLTGYLRGKIPRMPVTAVRMARKFMYFDNTKAVKYLGLTLTPVRQALEDAVAWFRQHKYV